MRRVHDFHGGVYPPERKELSNERPIQSANIPKQVILPLSQHIGPAAEPIVKSGDVVLGGQPLTDFSGLPVHAPTSGVISAIEPRPVPHASGMSGICLVLDCDGEDNWLPLEPVPDYQQLDRQELTRRLFEAGIAGLGGAGFPTARKMPADDAQKIPTLIINGTECEPYITADDVLMRERTEQIVSGVEILAHICQADEVLIGVEDNKPQAINALRSALNGRATMELVVFPTKYPSGGEKQLIEILTGQQVPSGGLPADIGILCQNVGTAVAVHDAIVRGRPLVSRITTVTGLAARERGNYEVLLGTPMIDLLEQAGFDPEPAQRLIMGGPMMGVTMPDTHCPIVKTTNCLLTPGTGELAEPAPAQACIRCGLCAEACPARLLPQQLYWYARSQDHEQLENQHLFDCIECGACSFVCPSTIPLVQYYRASKASIIEKRAENAKSERARVRFEARQERLEKAAAEKEARRAARKRAAIAKAAESSSGNEEDPIQAAIARAQAKKAAQAAAPADAGTAARVKLERIEARLAKARDKLASDDGSDPTISAALQKAVETTTLKLDQARAELEIAEGDKVSASSARPEPEDA